MVIAKEVIIKSIESTIDDRTIFNPKLDVFATQLIFRRIKPKFVNFKCLSMYFYSYK